jgi:hypothetical protein
MRMASMVSLPRVARKGAAEKQDRRDETYPGDFSHDEFLPKSEYYDDAGAKDIRADKLGSASSQLSGLSYARTAHGGYR